jgi:predicted outer membrane protein
VLTSIPRFVRWAVVVAVIGGIAAAVFQSWRAETGAVGVPDGWTETQFGPLGPADRDLLSKVRLAGLWEIPTGQEMQQRASGQRVQEVGAQISKEHVELDAIVRQAANQLGVVLPNQPTEEQQGWMAEISASSGAEYDRIAVNRLRAAHGKVLPVISQVRAGTRNDVVRKLAITAATFVGRHHEYLESTGLVDYSALPEPQAPGAPQPASQSPAVDRTSAIVDSPNLGTAAVVFVGALLAIVGLFAFVRGSRAGRKKALSAPAHSQELPRQRPPIERPLELTAAMPPVIDRGPRHAARRR